MSTFITEAAAADPSDNTSLTRLPTVMTRKEPKVKPPPPPPPPPRPEGGAAGGAGEGGLGEGAGAYEGMDREKILEQFRAKQAEREAARRKAMDEEVRFRWVYFFRQGMRGRAGGRATVVVSSIWISACVAARLRM